MQFFFSKGPSRIHLSLKIIVFSSSHHLQIIFEHCSSGQMMSRFTVLNRRAVSWLRSAAWMKAANGALCHQYTTNGSTVYHTAMWLEANITRTLPPLQPAPRKADGLHGTIHSLWDLALADQMLTCRNSGCYKAEQNLKQWQNVPLYTYKCWAH